MRTISNSVIRVRGTGLLVGLVLLCLSCGGGGGGEVEGDTGSSGSDMTLGIAGVRITPSTAMLTEVGETLQMSAQAFDAEGNEIEVEFSWQSSHPDELAVDENGLVTAMTVGSGEIWAVAFNAVSLLRRVCTLHVEAGLLDSNPAKGAKRLVGTVARRYKKEVERIDSWTFEESRKLLEIAADQEKNIYPAVLALLHTGMRRGEMIALRWEAVDFVRSRIVIRRAKVRGKITVPKSGKAREVPISPELADVLRELAGTRHRREGFANPEWVFLSTKGLQLMERNFNRSFARLTTAAAKKKVRPLNLHCCRHTFATMALESGRNIKWVAEILGHSDPTITLRTYAHAMHKDNDDLGFLANNRGESVHRLKPPQEFERRT